MNVKILHKEALNSEMSRFVLSKPWDFQAGQYTSILFNQKLSYFSIASSPLADTLELHIQNSVTHPLAPEFADFLNATAFLDLSPPQGKAVLSAGNRPVLLIAGGSGIAPLKSIADTLKILDPSRIFHLYWGTRNRSYFYDLGGLKYVPVLSDESISGIRSGFVHKVVAADFADLSPFDIYIAGPFAMAYAAREDFLKQGAKPEALFSDAFEFA